MKLFVALALPMFLGEANFSRQYTSVDIARQFVYSLEREGRDAIAVMDPSHPGMFVAALHLSSDLLVVRARHPSVDKIEALINAGQYLRVFSLLRATPIRTDKLYVFDARGNGILSSISGAERVDSIREDDGPAIRFDGVTAGQGLSADQYDQKLAAADAEYAGALMLLRSAIP